MDRLRGSYKRSEGLNSGSEPMGEESNPVRSQRGTIARPYLPLFATLFIAAIAMIGLPQIVSGAPLFGDDFETGDFSKWDSTYVESGNTLDVIAPAARDGSFGARLFAGGTNDDATMHKQIGASNEIYTRVWVNLQSDVSGSGYQIFQSAARSTFSSHVGALAIRRLSGANNLFSWAGSYSDTGSDLVASGWYCIETHVVVSATNGRMRVFVNDALVS